MNIDCRVIGDLLPLYADESCSDASRALVDDHLKTCPRCRETLARMKSEQFLPAAQAIDPPAVADYAQKVKHRRQKWVDIENGELLVKGMHISPYDHGNLFNQDPMRVRRLLAHKSEIRRLHQQCKLQGYTLVPLSLYFKHGRVKMEVGLCKGKKLYDKRADAAQRDAKRSIDRAVKSNGKYY